MKASYKALIASMVILMVAQACSTTKTVGTKSPNAEYDDMYYSASDRRKALQEKQAQAANNYAISGQGGSAGTTVNQGSYYNNSTAQPDPNYGVNGAPNHTPNANSSGQAYAQPKPDSSGGVAYYKPGYAGSVYSYPSTYVRSGSGSPIGNSTGTTTSGTDNYTINNYYNNNSGNCNTCMYGRNSWMVSPVYGFGWSPYGGFRPGVGLSIGYGVGMGYSWNGGYGGCFGGRRNYYSSYYDPYYGFASPWSGYGYGMGMGYGMGYNSGFGYYGGGFGYNPFNPFYNPYYGGYGYGAGFYGNYYGNSGGNNGHDNSQGNRTSPVYNGPMGGGMGTAKVPVAGAQPGRTGADGRTPLPGTTGNPINGQPGTANPGGGWNGGGLGAPASGNSGQITKVNPGTPVTPQPGTGNTGGGWNGGGTGQPTNTPISHVAVSDLNPPKTVNNGDVPPQYRSNTSEADYARAHQPTGSAPTNGGIDYYVRPSQPANNPDGGSWNGSGIGNQTGQMQQRTGNVQPNNGGGWNNAGSNNNSNSNGNLFGGSGRQNSSNGWNGGGGNFGGGGGSFRSCGGGGGGSNSGGGGGGNSGGGGGGGMRQRR